MKTHDLRLLPAAIAAWAGAAAGLLLDRRWSVALAVVGAVVGWRFRLAATRAGSIVFVTAMTIAALSSHLVTSSTISQLAEQRAIARVTVRLESDPQVYPAKGPMPARIRARGMVLTTFARGEVTQQRVPVTLVASGELIETVRRLEAGSVVETQVKLAPARRFEPVAATATVRLEPEIVTGPTGVDRATNAVRGGLRDAMRLSPDDQAGLVPSLVVGDTTRLPPSVSDDFKATGLTHLTAVSGTNLTLMVGFLTALCGWVGVLRWGRRAVQVAGVVGFVVICRGEPSVLRAASMGAVGLAALGGARAGPRAGRHLMVTVVVLCVLDPWLAMSWGFALSVAACVGILGWGARWQETMRRWSPGWLAEAIAIPLAAQIATQPLIIALSGQISVVGVVANALAGPFVGPVTVLGLLAAATFFIPPLSTVFGWLAGWCVQPIIWIAQLGASAPMGVREVTKAGWVVAVGVVACVLIGWGLGWVLARPLATLILVMSLLVVSVCRPPRLGWPGDWQVVACDVGQGDATAIRAGPREAMLVDAGPDDGDVVGCLHSLGVRQVSVLVLTHFHADHVGGAPHVIERFHVSTLVTSAVDSAAGRRITRIAEEKGVRIHRAAIGDVIVSGEATWHTVGAAPLVGAGESDGESSAENDASLIGIARSRSVSILIAGDAEPTGQRAALATGQPLAADILKLPHHGSARQEERFFTASRARVAIASSGKDNAYGHPAPRTVDLAERMGMHSFRTDRQGAIAITREGDSLRVRVQRGSPHAR